MQAKSDLASAFAHQPPLSHLHAAMIPPVSYLPGHSTQGRGSTTEELAKQLGLQAQSIQKRFSQTGSYFGVRPIKLPNRRLLWPADAIEQLTKR